MAPQAKGLGFAPMLGIAAVSFVIVLTMAGVILLGESGVVSSDTTADVIGSCWTASGGGDSFEQVSCDDSTATHKIVSHVEDPAECSGDYFEDGTAAFCIEPVSHG